MALTVGDLRRLFEFIDDNTVIYVASADGIIGESGTDIEESGGATFEFVGSVGYQCQVLNDTWPIDREIGLVIW